MYGAGATFFLPGADPIWSEPESAPGPRTSGPGVAKNSGGSASLITSIFRYQYLLQVLKIADPDPVLFGSDLEFFTGPTISVADPDPGKN